MLYCSCGNPGWCMSWTSCSDICPFLQLATADGFTAAFYKLHSPQPTFFAAHLISLCSWCLFLLLQHVWAIIVLIISFTSPASHPELHNELVEWFCLILQTRSLCLMHACMITVDSMMFFLKSQHSAVKRLPLWQECVWDSVAVTNCDTLQFISWDNYFCLI